MPTSRISEGSSGKMPTTSVRRPISLLKRSSGFVLLSFDQCDAGKVEGEDLLLRLGQHRRHLRQPLLERGDRLSRPLTGLLARLGLEDRPDQGGQEAVLVL